MRFMRDRTRSKAEKLSPHYKEIQEEIKDREFWEKLDNEAEYVAIRNDPEFIWGR